jgi:hypothetical protein
VGFAFGFEVASFELPSFFSLPFPSPFPGLSVLSLAGFALAFGFGCAVVDVKPGSTFP